MNELQAVKIQDRRTGLFRRKDGTFNSKGKSYTNIGYAKISIAGDLGNTYSLIHCDFVVFKSEGTYKVPVASYIIEYHRSRGENQYRGGEHRKKVAEIVEYCQKNNIEYLSNLPKNGYNKNREVLEGCPLCRGKALVVLSNELYRVQCEQCGCNTGTKQTKEIAISNWNNRV